MKVYPDKTVFGWPGDNGIGERLIMQVLRGEKTATCSLKEAYTPEELAQLCSTQGKVVSVLDSLSRHRCNIIIKKIFETTFGNPDPRLLSGEGYGSDAQRLQEAHRKAWSEEVAQGLHFNEKTVLMVELVSD